MDGCWAKAAFWRSTQRCQLLYSPAVESKSESSVPGAVSGQRSSGPSKETARGSWPAAEPGIAPGGRAGLYWRPLRSQYWWRRLVGGNPVAPILSDVHQPAPLPAPLARQLRRKPAPTYDQPRLSVVIVNYNRWEETERLVQQVLA